MLLVCFFLGGLFVACVWFCASRGALDDFFLTSSSRDMTATVLSNAALEKKKSVATLESLVLALVEGRTDLLLSGGVFGAGKTRSAAILVVGVLVFELSLNLMILTKENVAAQAFAEHIAAFALPDFVNSKIGRLVGHMELKKNKTNKTSLDVTCENRHEVLKQKRLLIGCGGGFQQECSQSYSPVARWIGSLSDLD